MVVGKTDAQTEAPNTNTLNQTTATSPSTNMPPVNGSILTCKVHTFFANENYKLPYRYDTTEIAYGSILNEGNYIIYMLDIQTGNSEKKVLKKITATQLMGANEPIEIIAVKGQDGYMTHVNGTDKSITMDLNYTFSESANYPTEYLFKITDNPNNYVKTSTLFDVQTSIGNTQCASWHQIRPETSTNRIDWSTDFAWIKSSDFYIKIGDKKFYGKEPIKLHSDPGLDKTTLEATWNENGVEMRLYMYFRKIDKGMWEMYDMRTYNGQELNPVWYYYQDSLGNSVKSLVGYHDYRSERTFKEPTYDAQIYCKDCDINAFMPRPVSISPSGYSLEPLIGLPKDEIITLTAGSNTGYGVNVLLRDSVGNVVKDQANNSYGWTVDDLKMVSVSERNLSEAGTCAYGIYLPCPKMHADLKGLKAGKTRVSVKVTRNTDKVVIAQTSFPVQVIEKDTSAEKIKQQKLAELEDKVEKLSAQVKKQESMIDNLSKTVDNLRNLISNMFKGIFH